MSFFKHGRGQKTTEFDVVPRHVAIIMDGNGRWAKKRGLPRSVGHRNGAAKFKEISRYLNSLGVEYATFYAFSTENWNRSQKEVDSIMTIFREYLKDATNYLSENIKMTFIGDRERLDPDIRRLMSENEEASAGCTGTNVVLAVNYGGRDEITHACRSLAQRAVSGELSPSEITEDMLCDGLYTGSMPPVDLLIRPGGEYRLSNYLLWQCAYAELWFTETLWPDFTTRDIDSAISDINSRQRRFGR